MSNNIIPITRITGCFLSLSDCIVFENYNNTYLQIEYHTDDNIYTYCYHMNNLPLSLYSLYQFTLQFESSILYNEQKQEYHLLGPHLRKNKTFIIMAYLQNPLLFESNIQYFIQSESYHYILDEYASELHNSISI